MKLQEGPAFGALIIGMGFAFFINQKTSNLCIPNLDPPFHKEVSYASQHR